MTYKQADFKPVLPNITDDSMREVDVDMEMVRRQNESRKGMAKELPEEKNTSETESKNEGVNVEQKSSFGRKIVIGILIVVIIVLLILLIYQIYKYYTVEEIPIVPPDINSGKHPSPPNKSGDMKLIPSSDKQSADSFVRNDGVMVIPQSTGGIPQSVRNLDNDFLSQYIKKEGNNNTKRKEIDSKEQTRARNVGHMSMIQDIQTEEHTDSNEMVMISQIIDETRDAKETYTNTEDIPSREDILQQLQRDMAKDKRQTATLESIEEEHGNDIISNFLSDDEDNNSVKSEDGGCQFVLTKGKNTGQTCGRKRSTETRCNRHQNK